MRPYVSIVGLAPDWAAKRGGRPGTYRPSAKEFRSLCQAVGKQLPRRRPVVALERAQSLLLAGPQRSAKRTPLSPSIYRNLYLAGHGGLEARAMRRHHPLRRADAARRHRPTQGPAARLPTRDVLPRQQLPPVPRAQRRASAVQQGRAHSDLGVRLSPVHARQGPERQRVRDDAAIGQLSRVTAHARRAAHDGASCPGARRSGSRSSAIRPGRPIPTPRRCGARPA